MTRKTVIGVGQIFCLPPGRAQPFLATTFTALELANANVQAWLASGSIPRFA